MRVLRRFRRKIMWVKNCIIAPPFADGWIKTRLGARIFKKLQTAEGYPLLLKPPYGTMTSFHLSFFQNFD